MKKLCQQCNREFSKPYNCSKKRWTKRKFCSEKCYSESMIGEPARNKDRKSLIDNLLKAGKNTRFKKGQKFSKQMKEKMKGKIPWNKGTIGIMEKSTTSFKKGQTPWNKGLGVATEVQRIRMSDKYKQWAKKILLRDNYICQKCKGRGGKLEVHHKKPVCLFPELIMSDDNAETVHKDCHYKIHKKMKLNQHIIKKYREMKTLGYNQ